ncbi:Thymidylate synthase, flavin-dependent [Elusimicrobium minutum Pei191]|uniref:Flavin-dependent thymidylate synthase n=1 Tax=Elusimicrobium minutum (strain Pei191) TaxID=445932 RepID=B2KAT3_ELUMP|nr:FAD-dependent thymidylate synthase [Elusimicrobium minutum]ACC97629.1 Thymidylate synthase, flavin-dependent [Elusimicrobium minutum Pei191]
MTQEIVKVLDKGFVKLVDFMGGDIRVVASARVTFGSETKGPEKDKALIKYLLENAHHSPFEHTNFQFNVRCPIYIARQWMRHRWGSYNEVSARYTEVKDEFYIPSEFRIQDTHNKQGSLSGADLNNEELLKIYEESVEASYKAYKALLEKGVAREMARGILPVCQYTQFYWTVNARSLLNFLSLRTDKHAQKEIRDYADAIAQIVAEKMPWTWEAFVNMNKKLVPSAN